MKYKIGDKVRIKNIDRIGTIIEIDKERTCYPYFIEELTCWWSDYEIECLVESHSEEHIPSDPIHSRYEILDL